MFQLISDRFVVNKDLLKKMGPVLKEDVFKILQIRHKGDVVYRHTIS